MFEDPNEVGKEWYFSEVAEKYDPAGRFDDKKFYNSAYQIKQHVNLQTRRTDVFITTAQSVRISPNYLSQK